MRLDKYLKVSRIIKRRTVAKEVCDAGRITVNGRPAKAGHEVKIGDRIAFSYGRRQMEVEIEKIAESMRAEEAATMYRVISDITTGNKPEEL
ncbi:MAG: RNA-binding S4 domain-containing protein [Clostridia bacterium]|nr:RNA-binding S4 domain-containing protein [Clostridia bacterium]MDD4799341.1 RNA-binding S4 domain-containing protein [Clostridia bacterium]